MATCVGTPVIGLYVTSNPLRTGPYLSQRWVVNKYPQALRADGGNSVDEVSWGQRVHSPDAMGLITVAEVVAKLDELMRARYRLYDKARPLQEGVGWVDKPSDDSHRAGFARGGDDRHDLTRAGAGLPHQSTTLMFCSRNRNTKWI
jgi:hypothetical protein